MANRPDDLERTQMMVILSHRLKDALDKQAASEGETLSGFVRRVCAQYIGYDIEAKNKEFGDKRKMRTNRKYKNAEEAREARNARQRERYQESRQLLDDLRRQARLRDVKALEGSLKK